VLRPASYCGVCGFKPSFGLISTDGVLPFARSLDTVGFFTATVADMACLWSRGFGGGVKTGLTRAARFLVPAGEPMQSAIQQAAELLRANGIAVDDVEPPRGWHRLADAAGTINTYEGARTHAARLQEFGDRIGTRLAALVRKGLSIPDEEYAAARDHVERLRQGLSQIFWEYPAILTPAATGPAPLGYESTGDPAANAPWTALGVPAISVPLPVSGAPLGLQVTAAWGRDDSLISVSGQIETLLTGRN
jgi:Asp-tRNA(Asn)/Glu-tRNA(Gln) amidotransferase A subunit family amidase